MVVYQWFFFWLCRKLKMKFVLQRLQEKQKCCNSVISYELCTLYSHLQCQNNRNMQWQMQRTSQHCIVMVKKKILKMKHFTHRQHGFFWPATAEDYDEKLPC